MVEKIYLENEVTPGDIRIEWEGFYLIISPDYFEYNEQKIYKKDADVHKVYDLFLKLIKRDGNTFDSLSAEVENQSDIIIKLKNTIQDLAEGLIFYSNDSQFEENYAQIWWEGVNYPNVPQDRGKIARDTLERHPDLIKKLLKE